ncbi:universal stress protein [Bosea sp. TAF32]|uniref:universal stress protein n=1 Tax=Bosea sp. TAF32 TaxID=3237482 RepID=UPI003F8EA42E
MTIPGEILLASDLSSRTDRAAERAVLLARGWQAKLAILHVTNATEQGSAGLAAEAWREELPSAAGEAELLVRNGSLPDVLAKVAAERGSGLIVTGVARYNDVRDYVVGTAVDYIVRRAAVPVLIVRRRADRPYGTIVVGTDFSEGSRRALLAAAELFPQARLLLVHAHPGPGPRTDFQGKGDFLRAEAEAGMKAFLDAAKLPESLITRLSTQSVEGNAAAAIEHCRAAAGAELVVVGRYGQGGFAEAVIGSTAETILGTVRADILIAPGA